MPVAVDIRAEWKLTVAESMLRVDACVCVHASPSRRPGSAYSPVSPLTIGCETRRRKTGLSDPYRTEEVVVFACGMVDDEGWDQGS